MRRISTGIQGRAILGSFVAEANRFTTREVNQDLVLEPDGTGIARSTTHLQIDDANSLRLADADSSAYVALRAPNTVASDVVLTLPNNEGSADQVLRTDGSGGLTWVNPSLTITDRTSADSNTYYVAMADSTTGREDTLSIASDRISFVPNPGLLTVNSISTTSITAGSVDIDGGAIDGTAIGASTRSTGAFTTLQANSTVTITATTTARQINPQTNNTYDLGSTSLRWRNIFTQDLHLNNGIGDYTIVEGEDDLFIYNNKRGKVYKFALVEVDPSQATPKIDDLNKVK